MNQNYLASALFAAVLFGVLAAHALLTRNGISLNIVVWAMACSWASCYLGAAYEQTLERHYTTLPGMALLATALLSIAVLLTMWAILRLVFGW